MTETETIFEPDGFEPSERLGILIEKSIRGELSEEEQRELGAALAEDPRLKRELDHSIDETEDIHAIVQRAMKGFNPEVARNAIDSELAMLKKLTWRIPLMLGLLLGWVFLLDLIIGPVYWPMMLLPLVGTAGVALIWARRWRANARAMRRAAQDSESALRVAFDRHKSSVESWIRFNRIGAVYFMVIVPLFVLMRGRIDWFTLIMVLCGLGMVYGWFSRARVDRVRGIRLGLIDSKGRRITKKGGSDGHA